MVRLDDLSAEKLRKHWSENVDDEKPDLIRDVAFQKCWGVWLIKFKAYKHVPEDTEMPRKFLTDPDLGKLDKKHKVWAWEYSSPNPEAKPRESKKNKKRKLDEVCDYCSKDDQEDSRLCISLSFSGIICCEDCLPTVEADDGHPLDSYKWESIVACL